jgi:hypothetical protein
MTITPEILQLAPLAAVVATLIAALVAAGAAVWVGFRTQGVTDRIARESREAQERMADAQRAHQLDLAREQVAFQERLARESHDSQRELQRALLDHQRELAAAAQRHELAIERLKSELPRRERQVAALLEPLRREMHLSHAVHVQLLEGNHAEAGRIQRKLFDLVENRDFPLVLHEDAALSEALQRAWTAQGALRKFMSAQLDAARAGKAIDESGDLAAAFSFAMLDLEREANRYVQSA